MGRLFRSRAGISHALVLVGAAVTVGAYWPATGYAQVPTGAQPGVIERPVARPPTTIEEQKQEIPSLAPKPESVTNPEQVVATFKSIAFKGNSVIGTGSLDKIAAKYLNRPMTRGDLAQLKYEVAKAYYDDGYILVQVVTPQQDVAAGVLNVEIYEAKVGTITVNNDNVLRQHVVNGLSSRVQPGDVFREQPVESMVNDFSDLTNVDAALNLRQGQAFGTTDMLLNLARSDEDQQRVSADNYGSKTTGRYNAASVNLQKSNFFKMGEKLNLDGFFTNELTYGGAGTVTLPTGLQNIFFEGRYIYSHISLGDDLEGLDAHGRTDIWEVALSKKFINMRSMVVAARGGFQSRTHQTYTFHELSNRDDIRQLFVEGSYLTRISGFLGYASLRVARGIDVMGASHLGDINATRIQGDPEATLLQPLLYATYQPIPKGELKGQISGQYATRTALASDLFILGGYSSVRGFEPAQATGESGVQASLEYDHTVWQGPWQGFNWTAAAGPFIDAGHVWNRVEPAQTTDPTLVAAGIGGQVETDVLRVGKTKLRVDIAFPIGSYSNTVGTMMTYFRLTQGF